MDTANRLIKRICVGVVTFYALGTSSSISCPGAEVTFDLPSSVAFRDVTSKEFASQNEDFKIVEAKLRISARIDEGAPSELVDFLYVIRTTSAMRVRDYFPKTTLESTVAADQIEITADNEDSAASGLQMGGAVKPLVLNGSSRQTSKKAESSHFKQLAPRDIVLASGTSDREHGVFFRIRPSRTSSLEGAREFTIVAVVARSWRGEVLTLECTARGIKKTRFSSSTVTAGIDQALVGAYLSSDTTAAGFADELCSAQERVASLLRQDRSSGNLVQRVSRQIGNLAGGNDNSNRLSELTAAQDAVRNAYSRLDRLAK
jgi:hypothetical protein